LLGWRSQILIETATRSAIADASNIVTGEVYGECKPTRNGSDFRV
jgi:hypothetical protein